MTAITSAPRMADYQAVGYPLFSNYLENVLAHGADPTGNIDSTEAIQAAIDCVAQVGGGSVYIPEGEYLVSKAGSAWCIDLGGKDNITIIGNGRYATKLKLAASQEAATRILSSQSGAVDGISIMHLTLDGNTSGNTTNEQRHGLFLRDATNVAVSNVLSKNNTGDGLYFGDNCQYITVTDCVCTDNDRNGVTIGGAVSDFSMRGSFCYGNAVQQFDSEGSTNDAMDNFYLLGNSFVASDDYAMAVGGVSTRLGKGWRVIGNRIESGADAMRIISADDIVVSDNYIKSGSGAFAGIEVYNQNTHVLIRGNYIESPSAGSNGAVSIIATTSALKTDYIIVDGNTISTAGGDVQTGIRVQGANYPTITNNHIIGDGAGTGSGINIRTTYPIQSCTITGNTLVDTPNPAINIDVDVGANRLELAIVDNNVIIDTQSSASVTQAVSFGGTMSQIGSVHIGTNLVNGVAAEIVGSAPFVLSNFGADAVAAQIDPGEITDSTGGATDGTLSAISGSGADTDINNNFAELSEDLSSIRSALVNLGFIK